MKGRRLFTTWPRAQSRSNVREPVSGLMSLPIFAHDAAGGISHYEGTIDLSVPQALALIRQLTEQVEVVCKRGDIRRALLDQTTGSKS